MNTGAQAITSLCPLGVILNNYKKRECFYVWAFTNLSWSVVNFLHDFVQQGVLFGVYFVLALHGLMKWKDIDKKVE